jgi:hypothetical protein
MEQTIVLIKGQFRHIWEQYLSQLTSLVLVLVVLVGLGVISFDLFCFFVLQFQFAVLDSVWNMSW